MNGFAYMDNLSPTNMMVLPIVFVLLKLLFNVTEMHSRSQHYPI